MADEKTEQKHTESLKEINKSLKKQKGTLGDQQAEIEAQIDISKARRSTIEGLIDVSGDLKVAEKDQLTTKAALKDQVTGAGMSIVQGAEGFVTDTFGGPIGGLINTLSMGFLTRMLSNRKNEKEKEQALEKQKEKEKELLGKRIDAMAEVALGEELIADTKDKEYKAQQKRLADVRKDISAEFKRREDEKKEEVRIIEEKKTQAFLEGKSTEDIAAIGVEKEEKKEEQKENGGEVVSVEGAAGGEGGAGEVVSVEGAGGEVAAGEGMSLDSTNEILNDIEEHLSFISGNQESEEDRRERLRDKGAKKAGGKVDVKKEDSGEFSFLGLIGTIIGAISGALLGASAGLIIGFLDMWKNIFKFIGGKLSKMFPNVTKMLSDTFGKGGKVSKFFTSMKTFFTQNKAFKTISDMIDTAKGSITKALKPVKTAFTTMKTGFTTFFTKIKSWIKLITGPIDTVKGLLGVGKSTGTGMGKFGQYFGKFFKIFKGFFSKLFLPLQVIISLVEGFFEAKDAVDKSEGMMATFFNAIVGFFGGILDGLIFGMLDLVKDGISWIAGFLGFKEVEKFLDSFSFSAMFNEFLDDIYKWFNLLFSDPVAALTNLVSSIFGGYLDLNSFILDMIKMPLVWLMELFGWDDAAAATESFSLSGTVMEAWDKVVAWVTGLFAWGKAAGATEEGGWSFLTFVESAWIKVKEWFSSLLSWGKEQPGVSWIMTTIDTVVETVKGWFTGLFSWASTEEEGDSWVVKTIKGIVNTVKEWFSGMFEFDSASGLLKSVLNIMMWIPNLFVKAVTGITAWFAGLLGFDKESEAIASAGKEFSFGDLIMKAVKAIGKWFGDLFDDIVNFDFKSLAKDIMPEWLANKLFSGKKEGEIGASDLIGFTDIGAKEIDMSKLNEALKTMNADQVKRLMGDIANVQHESGLENPKEVEAAIGARIQELSTGARGAVIVDKPSYLPSSGTVIGESPTWSGKGMAGGGVSSLPKIPDGGPEAVIPLAGQRGGQMLANALAPPMVGAILNQLQMERAGARGAEGIGAGAPPVITDSSTTVVNNNTTVTPPQTSGPRLPGSGRDHGVSHFTHAA